MLIETAVLDGDLGLSHDRGDLGERHDDAVLVVRGGDQRAVAGQDAGLLGQRVLGELAGQRVKDADPLAGQGPVAATVGIIRPAPSRPSTTEVATRAPRRLMTLAKFVPRPCMRQG